jgi:hypothetical protein
VYMTLIMLFPTSATVAVLLLPNTKNTHKVPNSVALDFFLLTMLDSVWC